MSFPFPPIPLTEAEWYRLQEMAAADEMLYELRAMGFADGDPRDLSDKPIQGCTYLSRVYEGQHQYLSHLTYDSVFLEALVEVFKAPKNTRKPVAPLALVTCRSWEEIVAAVGKVYL